MKWKKWKRKFRYNPKRSFMYLFLFLFLSGMGVGYSLLTTSLSISGTSKLKDAKWNVHFENVQVKSGSVEAITVPTISNDTSIQFDVSLEEPEEFYEFTVDVVNDGTIGAKLNSFAITPELTTVQKKYLTYEVKYSDGTAIVANQPLAVGNIKTIRVYMKYNEVEDILEYPEEDQSFTVNITLDYVQS